MKAVGVIMEEVADSCDLYIWRKPELCILQSMQSPGKKIAEKSIEIDDGCSIHGKHKIFYVRLLWMLLTTDLLPISIKSTQIRLGKQDNVTQNGIKRMQNHQKKTQNSTHQT